MKKRLFSILLALCMVLCLYCRPRHLLETRRKKHLYAPAKRLARRSNERRVLCLRNAEGALMKTAGNMPQKKADEPRYVRQDAPAITAADVQALIDALPEAETISEDNAADVEVQLEAIDE